MPEKKVKLNEKQLNFQFIMTLLKEYFEWVDVNKRFPSCGFAGARNEREKYLRKLIQIWNDKQPKLIKRRK